MITPERQSKSCRHEREQEVASRQRGERERQQGSPVELRPTHQHIHMLHQQRMRIVQLVECNVDLQVLFRECHVLVELRIVRTSDNSQYGSSSYSDKAAVCRKSRLTSSDS